MRKNIMKFISFSLAAVLTASSVPMHAYAFEGYEALSAGTYEGSSYKGYGGKLTVEVTVLDNGEVTAIEVTEHEETEEYFEEAAKRVIDSIIEKQSVSSNVVDAVSGATCTSEAIIEAVAVALSKAVPGFSSGTGTKADPFIISNVDGLKHLQKQVAEGYNFAGQYIVLSQDITLSGEWTPIGTAETPFAGTFNGQNHTIDGLTITGGEVYAGLFGYADVGSCFKNVQLKNVNIATTEVNAVAYAGAVVAFMKNPTGGATTGSVIDNCHVSGTISVTTTNKAAMVGGLCGMSNQYAAVANSSSEASVTVDTKAMMANVGGMVGMASVKPIFINNRADAEISVTSTNANSNIGGLCGTFNGIGYNNLVTGSVNATENAGNVGAVAGNLSTNSYVSALYYTGETAFGKVQGQTDAETVLAKSAEDINTAEFAQLLHDNLTIAALSSMEERTETAAIADCTDFTALTARVNNQYYDWENTNGITQLSKTVWASDAVDTGIFAGGSGTKEDPYLLSTEEQLRAFAVSLTSKLDYAGTYIRLANDIEVSEETWAPIGLGEYAFQGDFDGAGHSITGVTIGSAKTPYQDTYYNAELKTGGTYYGLFGVLGSYANVHNLVVDANIHVQSHVSVYVGGLTGLSDKATMNQVTINGTVWGRSGMEKQAANHFSGGIAGMLNGLTNGDTSIVTNCISNADVYGEAVGGVGEAGGIAGINNRSLVANCVANGKISGTADRIAEGMSSLGGICGVNAGKIVNCLSNSEIYSETYSQYVGSLAGWVTGIGELYCNTYSLDAEQKIAEQIVNPAGAVGWLVGPGINDEGEPYTGSVHYESNGYTAGETNAEALAAKLNATFYTFPVEMDVVLNTWVVDGENGVVPTGEPTSTTYVEPDVEIKVPETEKVTGTYYGRSGDELLVIKLTVADSVITNIEIVENKTEVNLDTYIQNVVENNGVDNLPITESGDEIWVKAAVASALEKMELNDTTGFGKVDASIFAGGNGTKENPYQIATEEQFTAFAKAVNVDESFEDIYLELTADITLSKEWVPAGSDAHHPFKCILNGNGHTIKGLTIGSKEAPKEIIYAGLFAYIEGGIVYDLTIEAPYIHTTDDYTNRIYAGALAAFVDQKDDADSYIDNCIVKDANITVHSTAGAGYAGGLFGSIQYGTITNCDVSVNIQGVSSAQWIYAGAVAGILARTGVINNIVSGNITAQAPLNKSAIGGLAGFHSGASYNNVSDITLTAVGTTNDVGALAGRNTGIGLMLDGYFNNENSQVSGDTTFEARGVGSIVAGENDGKGEVRGLTGLSAEVLDNEETVATLNANKENTNASLERVIQLLKDNWGVTFSSEITLKDWCIGAKHPVFAVTNKDVSTGSEDDKKAETGGTPVTNPEVKPNVTPEVNQDVAPQVKPEVTPVEKGDVLKDTQTKATYVVTKAGTTNGTVAYKKSTSTSKSVKIPDTVTIDGITYKVTSISDKAFTGNKKMTKVTIGKNVTSIGESAFANCKKLTKITIPAKVKKIGKKAFYNCKKLKNVTIETTKLTKKNVGSKAFSGIPAKAKVKVPKNKVTAYKNLLTSKGAKKTINVKK